MTKTRPLTLSSNIAKPKPAWWIREETWQAANSGTFTEMCNVVLAEGEYVFGEKIRGYDYRVAPALKGLPIDDMCDRISAMRQWLEERNMDVIAFDTAASGQYRDLAVQVLFRDARDAMLFKLTWL